MVRKVHIRVMISDETGMRDIAVCDVDLPDNVKIVEIVKALVESATKAIKEA